MRKWAAIVDAQRRMWQEGIRNSTMSRATTTVSDKEFNWMRDQALENPYAEHEEDDDDGGASFSGKIPRSRRYTWCSSRCACTVQSTYARHTGSATYDAKKKMKRKADR